MSVPHDVVNVAGMGRGMPALSRYSGFSYFVGRMYPPAMLALTDSGVAGHRVIEEFIYANPL